MRNFINRFWGNIIVHPSGCWNWKASKDKDGYGKSFYKNKFIRAHRLSYMIYRGKIDNGFSILHRCDNPSCVNPNHLYLGTTATNNHDRAIKNRNRNQNGELNNRAKLNKEQVKQILISNKTQSLLAKLFGVSQTHISKIKLGYRWQGGLL